MSKSLEIPKSTVSILGRQSDGIDLQYVYRGRFQGRVFDVFGSIGGKAVAEVFPGNGMSLSTKNVERYLGPLSNTIFALRQESGSGSKLPERVILPGLIIADYLVCEATHTDIVTPTSLLNYVAELTKMLDMSITDSKMPKNTGNRVKYMFSSSRIEMQHLGRVVATKPMKENSISVEKYLKK